MHGLAAFGMGKFGHAALKRGCRVLISAANPRDFNALLAQCRARILRLSGVRLAARKCAELENGPYSDPGIRLGQVGKRDMSEIVTAGILVIGDEILSG